MAGTDKILFERDGAVAHIVLNRPDKLNALDSECLDTIRALVAEIDDDDSVRAVVVRGNGRAFCAGMDLVLTDGLMRNDGIADFTERVHRTFDAIEACRKPTIAAVHGFAVAGGFELVQVTDFAVLADDGQLGDQHANYGLFPGGGATQRLPRLIGERRAKWLLISGEWLPAADCLAWGLVNEIVPADRLIARAQAMGELLASKSPLNSAVIKRSVRLGMRTDLATALAMERPTVLASMASEDARIGIEAFNTRTTPEFVGR